MVGNVFEWLEDCPHADYDYAPANGAAWMANCQALGRQNVLRGAGWLTNAIHLRSANRLFFPTDSRVSGIGFRVARSLVGP